MDKRKLPLSTITALAIAVTIPSIAADSTALKRAKVDEIQTLSQYDVREMVRRMSVEELEHLDTSKKLMVLNKLGSARNTNIRRYKDQAELFGEGREMLLMITPKESFDLDSALDHLPYGSYEVVDKGAENSFVILRSVKSNMDLLNQLDTVEEAFDGKRIAASVPKVIKSNENNYAYYDKEKAQYISGSLEEQYQEVLSLFTEGIEYVGIKVKLIDIDGSTSEQEIVRIRTIADEVIGDGVHYTGGPSSLFTNPTSFRYVTNRETLEAIYNHVEVVSILPINQ